MDVPGSSKLTDEQADFYVGRFGERYTTVQEQPLRPSRRVRRAKKGKRAASALTQTDLTVRETQHQMQQRLEQALTRPVL